MQVCIVLIFAMLETKQTLTALVIAAVIITATAVGAVAVITSDSERSGDTGDTEDVETDAEDIEEIACAEEESPFVESVTVTNDTVTVRTNDKRPFTNVTIAEITYYKDSVDGPIETAQVVNNTANVNISLQSDLYYDVSLWTDEGYAFAGRVCAGDAL